MIWAKGRQLASVSMGDETTGTTAISYAYDMDGIRRSKTVGGVTTEFVTQSGLVARQSWSGNTIDFFYDAQQRPYAMIYKPAGGTSVTYYYLTNLQGDVIALLDESGSVVAEYEYGAWGDIRSITDSSGAQVTSSAHIASINPLRYRGYYYDAETGFYYLQSRYYDPVIKRFINADSQIEMSLTEGLNLFAYCSNNPVMNSDPTGHSPQWLKTVGKLAIALAVVTLVSVAVAATAGAAAIAIGASAAVAKGVVIGAVVGGAVAGAVNIAAQSSTRKSTEFDYLEVAKSTAWGAGTSAISSGFSAVAATTTTATGIVAQKGMQAGANVILSDISYILQSARENESTFTGLAISSVGGFISGTSYNLSGLSALGVSVGIEASGYVEGFVIQLFGNRS